MEEFNHPTDDLQNQPLSGLLPCGLYGVCASSIQRKSVVRSLQLHMRMLPQISTELNKMLSNQTYAFLLYDCTYVFAKNLVV
jgi:hypothetical protein